MIKSARFVCSVAKEDNVVQQIEDFCKDRNIQRKDIIYCNIYERDDGGEVGNLLYEVSDEN